MTAIIPTQVIYSVQVTQLLKNHGYNTPELNLPESEWYGIDVLFKSDNVVIINGRVLTGHLKIQFVGEEQTASAPHLLLAPMKELFGITQLELDSKQDVIFKAGRCMPSVKYVRGVEHETIASPADVILNATSVHLDPLTGSITVDIADRHVLDLSSNEFSEVVKANDATHQERLDKWYDAALQENTGVTQPT